MERYGDRGDRGYRRQPTAPIKVGDIVEVTIEAVGEKGDGLAKISGFVLFIPGVKQGEKHNVKVTRVLRSVGFAEVVTGEAATKTSASDSDAGSNDDYAEESSEEATQEDSEDFL